MVEYAVALAFIVSVGVVFINNNGISVSIGSIFGNASNTLSEATMKPAKVQKEILSDDWLIANKDLIKTAVKNGYWWVGREMKPQHIALFNAIADELGNENITVAMREGKDKETDIVYTYLDVYTGGVLTMDDVKKKFTYKTYKMDISAGTVVSVNEYTKTLMSMNNGEYAEFH